MLMIQKLKNKRLTQTRYRDGFGKPVLTQVLLIVALLLLILFLLFAPSSAAAMTLEQLPPKDQVALKPILVHFKDIKAFWPNAKSRPKGQALQVAQTTDYRLQTTNKDYWVQILDPTDVRANQKKVTLSYYVSAHRFSLPLVYPKQVEPSNILVFENKNAVKLSESGILDENLKALPEVFYEIHKEYNEALPKSPSAFDIIKSASKNLVAPESIQKILNSLSQIEMALLNDRSLLRLTHNNLNLDNILTIPYHYFVVNWEKGGLGDPIGDVANFSNNLNMSREQAESFFNDYSKKWGWLGKTLAQKQAHFHVMRQVNLLQRYVLARTCLQLSKDKDLSCKATVEESLAKIQSNQNAFNQDLKRLIQ